VLLNADIIPVDVLCVEKKDPYTNAIELKGLGEIALFSCSYLLLGSLMIEIVFGKGISNCKLCIMAPYPTIVASSGFACRENGCSI
jgi:hypothetical protein